MFAKYAVRGDRVLPAEDVTIDIRSQGFNYGASVFEGIRAYWSDREKQLFVFRIDAHLGRLRRSGATLGMSLPDDVGKVSELLCDLIRRNEFRQDVYIRPIVYKGVPTSLGISLADAPDEFVAYAFPLGEYLPRERPLRVCVSSWERISDNAVPARCKIGGSYINPALAKTDAIAMGFDECLMLTRDGSVAEGTTSNLFLVVDGELVTPASTEDILVGITRNSVIRLAGQELGLVVEERQVDRSELYQATEAFLCGTGAEIASIGEIDGRPIGDGGVGSITGRLRELYVQAVVGRLDGYHGWLTPVYEGP